jgi:hypothetical protein
MPVFGGSPGPFSSGRVVQQSTPPALSVKYPTSSLLPRLAQADLPAGTYLIVNHNNTQVLASGGGVFTVEKISGAVDTRDAGAVSQIGLTGDFVLRLKHLSTIDNLAWNAGMNSDPLTDDDYASIDFSWFYTPSSALWTVGESGAFPTANFADATYAWIWRVGTTLGYGRGADLATAQASPDRTVTTSATLYFDSSIPSIGGQFEVLLADLTTVAYSMTAAVGTFAYTGQAAGLLQGYDLTAGAGTFTYTGQAALLERGYDMVAAVGTFSYAGQAALLERGYDLTAANGTFTYSGQTTNLRASYLLPMGVGTFTYSGQAALLEHGYSMPASVITFTYSGQAVGLLEGFDLTAAAGTYSYSGQAVGFGITAHMPGGLGTFSYAGQPARALLNLDEFPPSSGGSAGPKVVAFMWRP